MFIVFVKIWLIWYPELETHSPSDIFFYSQNKLTKKPTLQQDALNPQIADNDNLLLDEVEAKLEEICGELRDNDLAFFIVRCFALFFCLVGIIIILVNICRGKGI